MITNFSIPELNNHDVQELWFLQDGATCHTARDTIDLLKDTFCDRIISRFEPVNWLPRFCDLTPLHYFLWRYVKLLVYADKPQTLDHLKDNIRRVIADIRPQMLEKVIENWTSRLDYIRASRDSHMPEIIFKIGTFTQRCENSKNWLCSSEGYVSARRSTRIPHGGELPYGFFQAVDSTVVYCYRNTNVGFVNLSTSAALFVEWAQNEIAVVSDFHKRILFKDEAHFWSNGYVNKQNCRIWSEANPQVYVETPLHPEKLTVWCALWAG
ncbi:transposable element Tc3 transposase [Trichonephila clavipes]|nr:transposable element Tc3 transposase [Trichonephila clavipes]